MGAVAGGGGSLKRPAGSQEVAEGGGLGSSASHKDKKPKVDGVVGNSVSE